MIIGTCHVCSPAYRMCRILARSRAELSETMATYWCSHCLTKTATQGSDETESQTHEPQAVHPFIGTAHGKKSVGEEGIEIWEPFDAVALRISRRRIADAWL